MIRAAFGCSLEVIESGGQSLQRHVEAFRQSHDVQNPESTLIKGRKVMRVNALAAPSHSSF
jgi:hypothetical protein